MKIIRREGKWRLLDRQATLLLMDERTLDRIAGDPSQPLMPEEEQGFSGEKHRIYDQKTSLVDVCTKANQEDASRLEVSYDFFFGGSKRSNYPDSPATLEAYKVICDTARKFGMTFSASIVSPLDLGPGYARSHQNTGRVMQFKECAIGADGRFEAELVLQTQWTNNKGPVAPKLLEVRAYAFNESRIGDTACYYVDENNIDNISSCVKYEIDNESITVSAAGYGCGRMKVHGTVLESGKNRCLVAAVYETPEMDYFDPDTSKYMKSVIDLHNSNGIKYAGFYSDEMHIQFDWDLENHFGHDSELNTRYVTESLAGEYADRFGDKYSDFGKYLLYFAYHQHDFMEGEEGLLPSQHVMGSDRAGVMRTWLFRKHYYEMLQRHVVDLCLDTKAYAEALFGAPIMTRAHSTWQEAPTCDRFVDRQRFSQDVGREYSRYEYLPEYVWSSSIREDIAACYDYFKWNEYLTGGGTDHPEGGFLDRNYYGSAFAASLALLNKFPFSYYGMWGSPAPVIERLADAAVTYGNQTLGSNLNHNFIQGLTPRLSEVLTLYPLDLNYVEERFGSWMIQYGYTDYITEEQLVKHFDGAENRKLIVRNRQYGTLLVLYSPMISQAALSIVKKFLHAGGRVVWCSSPALDPEDVISKPWRELFGIDAFDFGIGGISAEGKQVCFDGILSDLEPMEILTDMLPDLVYPVIPDHSTESIASLEYSTIGTLKQHASGGLAVFLGFRPRDDQSCSTGRDISTLFDILTRLGSYAEGSGEAMSRPADSRYIVNCFPNGSVSVANHMRTIKENWYGSFFRDEEADCKILEQVQLTSDIIEFDRANLFGHEVTYKGKGALTYRLNNEGVLDGFAGKYTTGIMLDNITYCFKEAPAEIAWFRISEEDLEEGITEAYAVRCFEEGRLTLPFDSIGMQAACCGRDLHETGRSIGFAPENGNTIIEVGLEEKEQWLVIFK